MGNREGLPTAGTVGQLPPVAKHPDEIAALDFCWNGPDEPREVPQRFPSQKTLHLDRPSHEVRAVIRRYTKAGRVAQRKSQQLAFVRR